MTSSSRSGALGRNVAGSTVLAALLTLVLAAPESAAIFASLSSPYGRPGDQIVLTTDDFRNPHANDGLSSRPSQPVYLISASNYAQLMAQVHQHVCGTPGQTLLGKLTWKGDVGAVTFKIPSVEKGDYFFFVDVSSEVSNPPCWRIGAAQDALMLTVGDQPARPAAATTTSRPVASNQALVLALVGLGGGLIVAAGLTRSLRRRSRPSR